MAYKPLTPWSPSDPTPWATPEHTITGGATLAEPPSPSKETPLRGRTPATPYQGGFGGPASAGYEGFDFGQLRPDQVAQIPGMAPPPWDMPGYTMDPVTGEMMYLGYEDQGIGLSVDPAIWGRFARWEETQKPMHPEGLPPDIFATWYNTQELPRLAQDPGASAVGGALDEFSGAAGGGAGGMGPEMAAALQGINDRLAMMEDAQNAKGQDPWALIAAMMNNPGQQEPFGGGSSYTFGPMYPGGNPYQ